MQIPDLVKRYAPIAYCDDTWFPMDNISQFEQTCPQCRANMEPLYAPYLFCPYCGGPLKEPTQDEILTIRKDSDSTVLDDWTIAETLSALADVLHEAAACRRHEQGHVLNEELSTHLHG